MKILLTLFSLLFFAACQQNTPPATNQTAKPNATVSTAASSVNNDSANVPPAANGSDKSKIKFFDGKGAVTKINLELGSIALDHEEIKGLMPAMEGMEFYVSDKKLLDRLKVGDRVDFVLEDNAGAERIVSIKKN